MAKINQEEYELLKSLDDKWKWIARDDENQEYAKEVYAFIKEPEREDGFWNNKGNCDYKLISECTGLFRFVKWEDDEPYSIAELIEEYESEETEMKDLEWLKKELAKHEESNTRLITDHSWEKGWNRGYETATNIANDLIDEMDEPETLSQEWINTHIYNIKDPFDGKMYKMIKPDDLQNILVPNQEITEEQAWNKIAESLPISIGDLQSCVRNFAFSGYSRYGCLSSEQRATDTRSKPVIPQFVADYIEVYKKHNGYLVDAFRGEHSTEVHNWFHDYTGDNNQDIFAQAWLAYPDIEVEQEPKYRVKDGNTTLLGRINGLMLTTVEILEYYPEYTPTFELTEQEIKDYDERYFAFAKPVEEVEE